MSLRAGDEMASDKEDEEQERRIAMEIVVDAYGEEERALSWYYYLEENLQFPFRAKCVIERPISPLRVGEDVEAVGMPPEEECEHEMFVKVRWSGRELAVSLSQLQGIEVDKETEQAMEDWRYWVDGGHEF